MSKYIFYDLETSGRGKKEYPNAFGTTPKWEQIMQIAAIVTDSGGKIHRLENIGSRKLAYQVHDQYKATYALLNIECKKEAISEIQSSFKFND